ncbi:MAG: hypothetical protein G01um101449_89 [Parcubacteria group bacterium Gr01-1014_49]|nr:MAG: hypothetical protein G01um101449_89 [Parcubacteria group bacterium Gr01-1014_49]
MAKIMALACGTLEQCYLVSNICNRFGMNFPGGFWGGDMDVPSSARDLESIARARAHFALRNCPIGDFQKIAMGIAEDKKRGLHAVVLLVKTLDCFGRNEAFEVKAPPGKRSLEKECSMYIGFCRAMREPDYRD